MMIKATYSYKAPGSKEDCTVTCTDKKSYIDLNKLNDDNTTITQYGSCEWNRTLLDGSFSDLPSVPLNQVYISESMSDSNGDFSAPIVITRTFGNQYTAPGISFTFDNGTDECYCDNLNVKWYRGDTLLYSVDYNPDSTFYFCQQIVEAFNKIVITFNSTSKPYRFLRIVNIDDGVNRDFTEDELTGVKIIEEISESGDSLSINTAELSLISKNNIDYVFQRTQPIDIYNDDVLIGKYFNSESERSYGRSYQINAEDYIGFLDRETFYGGIYTNKSLKTLLTEICGDVSHDYDGEEVVNGYLAPMSRRSALQYVAFATNKVIDCSRSDTIKVRTLSDTVKDIPDSRVMRYPSETTDSKVTKIIVAEHSMVANGTEDELINEVISGTYTYVWDDAHYDYSITGGTIVESSANYITITGTGNTVVLTGKGYDDISRERIITNPLATTTDLANVVSKTSNRLVTSANISSVLEHLATVCFRNKQLSATIILEDEKVGDKVRLSNGEGTMITGVINSMTLDLHTGLASVEILEV